MPLLNESGVHPSACRWFTEDFAIVRRLIRRGWSNERIHNHMGMPMALIEAERRYTHYGDDGRVLNDSRREVGDWSEEDEISEELHKKRVRKLARRNQRFLTALDRAGFIKLEKKFKWL